MKDLAEGTIYDQSARAGHRYRLALLPGLLLALSHAGHAADVGEAQTAAIRGTVTITRSLTAQKMRFRLYPGVRQQPPPTSADLRSDELANVVIFLESDREVPLPSPPAENPRVTQEGETFIPHVLPILRGTTVDFPNLDPIFHNVFSLSSTREFDLGRYPQGESRSVTFDQAGIVPVFCHLHSDMSAVIVVLEHPYFTQPGPNGSYALEGLQPGDYTIVAWHQRSGRVEQGITIRPGEELQLDLTVPVVDDRPGDG